MAVKPAIAWIGTNRDALFINNCGVVLLGLANNTDIYATPVPGLPVVQGALDTFSADQMAAIGGGVAATAKKKNSRLVLAGLMRQLAAYVTVACQGNLHNLVLSGFPPQKTERTPVGILPAPQGLSLKQGPLTGLLIAKASPVFGAAIYNWTCTPNTPGAVPMTYQSTATNWTIGGLTPGVIYAVAVNAVGAAGPSNWSSAVSLMVI